MACKASLLTPLPTSSTSEGDSSSLPNGLTVSTNQVDSISLLVGFTGPEWGGRQHQSTDWDKIFWDDVRRDLACFADKEKQLMSMLD